MPLSKDEQKEFWACLALKHTRGVGPRTWKRLLDAYGTAYRAVMDAAFWPAKRLARQTVSDELRNESWRAPAQEEWEAVRRMGCSVLLHSSPHFPEHLREIPDPPLYLYAQGELTLLEGPAVAVVGTRQSTNYGREATRELCLGLSNAGVTIVSGLAYGIDRQAHMAGLQGVGGSIAVLGAGLDSGYPAEMRTCAPCSTIRAWCSPSTPRAVIRRPETSRSATGSSAAFPLESWWWRLPRRAAA